MQLAQALPPSPGSLAVPVRSASPNDCATWPISILASTGVGALFKLPNAKVRIVAVNLSTVIVTIAFTLIPGIVSASNQGIFFMQSTTRLTANLRSSLLVSSALLLLAGAQSVQAQESGQTAGTSDGQPELSVQTTATALLPGSVAAMTVADVAHTRQTIISVNDTPSITINNNFTPTDARDPTNLTGVGLVVTDAGGGGVGLCTASKINPRVVLFAAHCVNNRAATAYGANSGGVGISIGFETNTRANAPGQVDELVRWLLGTGPSAEGRFQTNQAQSYYNINQVFWHPGSVAPASCTNPSSCFLEADIATAVLDTPALDNIPTWALLFSPMPTPATINPATGTGYHVTITGYGRNGNGTTGASGNDFRRRVAENMLGALTSISERNLFLFGSAGSPARPQLLYWLDFDDPTRTNTRDFNGFRDNALPREGLTGPGDSGGPLIIDQAYAKQVVIGVLSGGSTFFGGQPGGSYGTQSFYQPLFLYWDWIVANNPYRYVSAVAGNRNWEDAAAWVTELDPAYHILTGFSASNPLGTLTNGLPTNLGGTNTVTTPKFGEFCFQLGGTNECQNIATGAIRNGVPNNPSDSAPMLSARITDVSTPDIVSLLAGDGQPASGGVQGTGNVSVNRSALDGAFDAPSAYSATLAPAPTLANGLPGATNFVPNNVDGVRTTGVMGRYYDVTLRNAGTVTLNSTVTVDRFTVRGASSQLTVASGASLTSLLSLGHLTGIVNVNGTINAPGEYLFASGLLTGTGRVNAPFLTSVMGNFAPGTVGTVGSLTIGGNLVMGSASTYAIDLGANGVSDRLVVVASTTTPSSTGLATLGGNLQFGFGPGSGVQAGNVYTILTAAGGVTGTFNTPSALTGVLRSTLLYGTNQVQMQITTVPYASVIDTTSPVQAAYAALLDANRNSGTLGGIFPVLDLANTATIRATLEALAPRTETLRLALGTTAMDAANRLIRNRVQGVAPGVSGGSVAYIGKPIRSAAMAYANARGNVAVMGAAGAADTEVREGKLPDNVSAFFAGGYIDGDSAPMATALPAGGRDQFNGWYIGAGAELHLSDTAAVGFGLSYTDLKGTTGAALGTAKASLIQGSLYAKHQSGPIAIDGQFSAGLINSDTSRPGGLPGLPYTLTSNEDGLALAAEANLSAHYGSGSVKFGPSLGLRWSQLDFGRIVEAGGPTALVIDPGKYSAFEGRAGFNLFGQGRIRPSASVHYVHGFDAQTATFNGQFVGGIPTARQGFALGLGDRDWVEASLGLAITAGKAVITLSADTTIERDDVDYRAYRASVLFRF